MANTLYAAFDDATLAEKAAGALLDHGVRAEDLSMVQHESRYNMPTTVAEDTGVSPDVRGSMTGATIDSPGVVGAGSYETPMDSVNNMDAGDITPPIYTSRESGDASDPVVMDADENVNSATYAEEDDFATARNQADYDRETASVNRVRNDDGEVVDISKTEHAAKSGISTTTPADAGSAAITGGALGLGVGAVAALAALLIPGVGIVVGGGALATAIAGIVGTTGAGAAVGAVTGYLKDQGVEEHVAHKYGETIVGGGAVLAVHVPSGDVDEIKARELLEKYGASNVNTYAMAEGTKPYMA
jgi:hypothetical protein